jgi:hypothetical protein
MNAMNVTISQAADNKITASTYSDCLNFRRKAEESAVKCCFIFQENETFVDGDCDFLVLESGIDSRILGALQWGEIVNILRSKRQKNSRKKFTFSSFDILNNPLVKNEFPSVSSSLDDSSILFHMLWRQLFNN